MNARRRNLRALVAMTAMGWRCPAISAPVNCSDGSCLNVIPNYLVARLAAQFRCRCGVVISGNPYPFTRACQCCNSVAIFKAQALRTIDVMKTVTQGDDLSGLISGNCALKHAQCLAGIIGWQMLIAAGKKRAFFEMQVRNNEGALPGPV